MFCELTVQSDDYKCFVKKKHSDFISCPVGSSMGHRLLVVINEQRQNKDTCEAETFDNLT